MPVKGKKGWKFRWTEDRVYTMLRIYSMRKRPQDPKQFDDFIGKDLDEKIVLYKELVRQDVFP